MKMFNRSIAVTSILSVLVALAACDKDETKPRGASEMSVRMHDSAGVYAHVYIDVIGAEVHYSDDDDETSGWRTLEVNAGLYDLLEFQDGHDTLLVDTVTMPAGKVTQFRLILGSNNSLVLVGQTNSLPLDVPSGSTSGLKLNLNHEFEANKEYEMTLDFDVHSSIVVQGNGEYKLKPVIKVESITEID